MTDGKRMRRGHRAMWQVMRMRGHGGGHQGGGQQGGGRRGGRGGGHRARPLGHGELRLLVLSLIGEGPRHGYDLITQIETRTGGAYKPSPGVIYPALDVLQDMGLALAKAEDGKKVLHLTDAGKAELDASVETIGAINARLAALASPAEDDAPDDVRAAMRRLRHCALRAAMASEGDKEKLTRIAAALKRAREEVEGL